MEAENVPQKSIGVYPNVFIQERGLIELALKACISKKMQRHKIPDKKFIVDCYTHDLKALVKLAGLEYERNAHEKTDPSFAVNWAIVKEWNESARYEFFSKSKAEELISSINSNPEGVLLWIQQHW